MKEFFNSFKKNSVIHNSSLEETQSQRAQRTDAKMAIFGFANNHVGLTNIQAS